MAEMLKNLKTRIALKYDTLGNWEQSSLVLNKGEVAFSEITVSNEDGTSKKYAAIKVGDGVRTWKDLDFTYANAIDVLPVAKSEAALIEFVGTHETNTSYRVAADENDPYKFHLYATEKGGVEVLQDTITIPQPEEVVHPEYNLDVLGGGTENTRLAITKDGETVNEIHFSGINGIAFKPSFSGETEFIVADGKELLDKINVINNADTGILAQAKAYADEKDAETLQSAKDYSDDNLQAAKDYSDANLETAKGFTTTSIAALDAEVDSTGSNEIAVHVSEVDGKITAVTVAENLASKYATKDEIAALDATVTSAEVAAGTGIQVTVTETDGLVTAVTVNGNYDEKYAPKVNNYATKEDIAALDATVSTEAVAEEGKGIQITITEEDGKLTSATLTGNFDNKYDEKGAAAAVDAKLADYATTEALNGAVETLNQTINDKDAAMDERVDALEAAMGEDGSVAEKIAAAINALDADVTSEDNDDIAVRVVEVDGKITEVHVTADLDAKYATDKDLSDEIARAQAAEKANADEIARVNGVLLNAIENNAEGLDSIKELADWISTHGTEASAMAESIADLESISAHFLTEGENGNVTPDAIKNYIDAGDKALEDKINDLDLGDHNVIEEITVNGTKVEPVNKSVALGKFADVNKTTIDTSDLSTGLSSTINNKADQGTVNALQDQVNTMEGRVGTEILVLDPVSGDGKVSVALTNNGGNTLKNPAVFFGTSGVSVFKNELGTNEIGLALDTTYLDSFVKGYVPSHASGTPNLLTVAEENKKVTVSVTDRVVSQYDILFLDCGGASEHATSAGADLDAAANA